MRAALIVDDDPVVLSMAQAVLGDEGYTVDVATTAVEAMSRLRSGPVDLLVVDVKLPELDGFALLSAVRNLGLARDARVVLISALDDGAAMTRAKELGVTEYVVKPIDVVDLQHLARSDVAIT